MRTKKNNNEVKQGKNVAKAEKSLRYFGESNEKTVLSKEINEKIRAIMSSIRFFLSFRVI